MTDQQLTDLAETEDRIAAYIDKNYPGYFLTDDPIARHAAGAARLRAIALRSMIGKARR